jgi:hypothetical protein
MVALMGAMAMAAEVATVVGVATNCVVRICINAQSCRRDATAGHRQMTSPVDKS